MLRLLDQKAFSSVWAARDLQTCRAVVLKLVPAACYSVEVGALERLTGVSGVVDMLAHEDWRVAVRMGAGDVCVAGIVLEMCEGGDLFEWVNSSAFAQEDAIVRRLFLEISTALQSCHHLGICHLNLKLENVLLSHEGHALLSDFGVSVSSATTTQCCGTPGYIAPETTSGQAYDPKAADIFALGVLLFALITKKLPFQGLLSIAFLDSHPEQYWARLAKSVSKQVSPLVRDLFAAMVRLDPAERMTIDQVVGHPWLAQG